MSLAAGSAALLAPALISPATAQVPSWEQAAAQAGPLYSKALQFFAMKNYQSCIECCKMAAKGDPRNKNIPHLCALAYSEMGDTYNANIQFRAALTLDYNFVECHNNYGIFLNKKGEPEEAKKQFKECIRLNPRYAKAYYNLGSILQAQADLDGAVQQYRQAVAIDPNYFDAQRDLGLVLFQKFERGDSGEISESLDKLLAAERLVPDNPMIHYHLGYIYCCNGDLDEGETELRKALMADTQLAAAHYELGRLRYLRGDPNRALFEVKVAQKINPMLAEAKKYPTLERKKLKELQAKCEELTENYDDAIASWNEVASLTANNAPIKKHMSEVSRMARNGGRRDKNAADPAVVKSTITQGISETEEGNLQAATQTFTRASEMDPKNFIPCQNLGLIYEAQDQLEQAIPMYQRALDLKPKYDGLYYNMAYVLEGLNRRAEAGAWYKRFHDLAGKYPYDPKHIVSLQQEDARVRAQEGTH
ncbi:MAG: tetratricopeptide repeat protein [Cyanobacteria bacterium SZAS TMP-1]|nr:tetratricopeptide repeat protein [Cyanobacteria bacterium SZAS TMP-1]